MRKRIIRSRRARYGGMSVLLTVLLIATVVLFNSLFSTLAKRYSWYVDMHPASSYEVSEACYTLLGSVLEGKSETVKLIFCDTEKNLKSDSTSSYVYKTATSLAARFPGKITTEFHNIWLDPASVKQYTTTLSPATGEMVDTALKSTNVIVACGDYYRVYDLTEFFVFADGDTSKLWAYNGEKKLASGVLHALDTDGAVVGMTNNHGEVFYDYELFYLLDDAGYSIRYFNLYTDPIPEGCDLIVSFNPNTDLVNDDLSATSEVAKLNEFLSKSGNGFLVFIENGTPALPQYRAFLEDWGVHCDYYESGERSFRYMVQDPSRSLTSDGYTIYGDPATAGRAAEYVNGLTRAPIFKNATSLSAQNGFVSNGDGSYTKGNRTFYSLFTASETAVSWANGKPVSDAEATLFAITEQTNGDGNRSYVGVCASTDFATEEFLQSAVHGNTDTMMQLFERLGKTNTPKGLTIKPFQSTDISTVTTAQMWKWTVALALIPVVSVSVAAILILVRRRNA
ncbi:MAG: hypothetical protein E7620_08085 [Ruminococcaceae bacterium]|nr:hypothetical protein [Oscillospiraceae bacterium]